MKAINCTSIADRLLESDDPVIRFQARIGLLGETENRRVVQRDRAQIPDSPIVKQLLCEVNRKEIIPGSPYSKWRGSHWVLAFLAELCYPRGDEKLRAMANRNANWALGMGARLIEGRWRRCASQQGYALLYLMKLGFFDDCCDQLAHRLMLWQWPDGGWNCDKAPAAHCSSFDESLIPMRALFHFARHKKRRDALAAAQRAAEFFLDRRLFKRKSSGSVIKGRFIKLNYPYDWRYTFIHGLKCMAEANLIRDPRCKDALDLLESKRQPNGGWRAETKYYSFGRPNSPKTTTLANWSACNVDGINPFLTCDATAILRAAGRL